MGLPAVISGAERVSPNPRAASEDIIKVKWGHKVTGVLLR